MGKPKICFIASSPFTINVFLRGHITALSDRFDVTVITATQDSLAALVLPAQINVVDVGMQRSPSLINDAATLLRLWRVLRKQPYLAVLTITPKAGLLGMLAAACAGVPNRFHYFTGQVWATRQGVRRFLLKACDRMMVSLASRVFADGHSQARFLVAQGVVTAECIEVLGPGPVCGVDTKRFCTNAKWRNEIRKQLDIPDEAKVVLFLGRLHIEKGIYDLLSAFEVLMENGQAQKTFLLLVGPTDDVAIKTRLNTLPLKVKDQVRTMAGVPDPERYMAAADVFVLPSYREGFGMVVLEAAAAGVPAIVSDIYGLADAVEENITALKVPVAQPIKLATAIHRLLSDDRLRADMGAAAMARVKRAFPPNKITAAWLGLYIGLMAEGVPKTPEAKDK